MGCKTSAVQLLTLHIHLNNILCIMLFFLRLLTQLGGVFINCQGKPLTIITNSAGDMR